MARRKSAKKPTVKLDWERLYVVEKLVDELVAAHHPHLTRAKILVLGKPKASKRGDRVTVARGRAVTPAVRALLKDEIGDAHYLIEVGRDAWDPLGQERKRITIDRELCKFIGQDDKGRWATRDYDVKEFTAIIGRYGLCDASTELFAQEAKKQLELALPA
jgi:hypothetical protein